MRSFCTNEDEDAYNCFIDQIHIEYNIVIIKKINSKYAIWYLTRVSNLI